MADSVAEPVIRFWVAFWPVWSYLTLWVTAIMAVILIILSFLVPVNFFGVELLVLVLASVLCAGAVAVVIRFFPLYLTEDGLRCTDINGRYRFVRWNAIELARPINMAGLRYLRLYSVELPRPIWLPLFMADMDGLVETVYRLNGRSHLLVQALERCRR